jgi:hypothetical protein
MMQTLIITPQFENGKFYFELPDNLKGSEITIQLVVKKDKTESSKNEDRLEKIRTFAGIGKDAIYEPDANEWYNQ